MAQPFDMLHPGGSEARERRVGTIAVSLGCAAIVGTVLSALVPMVSPEGVRTQSDVAVAVIFLLAVVGAAGAASYGCSARERSAEDITRYLVQRMAASTTGLAIVAVLLLPLAFGHPPLGGWPSGAAAIFPRVAILTVVGAPAGALLGWILTPPLQPLCAHDVGHESLELTVLGCSTWLAIVCLACAGLVAALGATGWSLGESSPRIGAVVIDGVMALVSIGVAFGARRRRLLRRRWIERVRGGHDPDWEVVAIDPLSPERPGLKAMFADLDFPTAMLVRVDNDRKGGAYRADSRKVPVALL